MLLAVEWGGGVAGHVEALVRELRVPAGALYREEHLVEEPEDGGVEVLLVGGLPGLELRALQVPLRDAIVGLLGGVELPRGLLHAGHARLVAREHAEVVLPVQPLEEALHLVGRDLGVGAHDGEHPATLDPLGDVGKARQRQDFLVAGLARRFEHPLEAVADEVVDPVLRRVVGEALEELRQVFLAIEPGALFGRVVQVPGHLFELFERSAKLRRFAKR